MTHITYRAAIQEKCFQKLRPRCDTTVVVRCNGLLFQTTLRGITTGTERQTTAVFPQSRSIKRCSQSSRIHANKKAHAEWALKLLSSWGKDDNSL